MGDYINKKTRTKLIELKFELRLKTYGAVIDKLIEIREEHLKSIKYLGPKNEFSKKEILEKAKEDYEEILTKQELKEYFINEANQINKKYKELIEGR